MALSLSIGPRFAQQDCEFTITRSSLFLGVGRCSIFADLFGAPDGAPRWEVSRWELSHGWRVIVGSFMAEIGTA
jgi:hypothetical protein